MFAKHEPEALVVGAGPVGLFSALTLADRSVDVEIVDEETRTAAHSYALALHPRSLEMLDELGVQPESIENSLRIETIAFYDGMERKTALHLGDLPLKHPYLLVLRQSHAEDLLERHLRDRGVSVKWHHRLWDLHAEEKHLTADLDKLDRVSTGYAVATTETEIVKKIHQKAGFIIGADGHRSRVRQILGIDFEEVGPPELFAVFEFECDPLVENEVRVVLDGRTTNVLWPLPDGRCRWSFQVWDEPDTFYDLHYKSRLAVQVGRDFFPQVTPALLGKLIEERAPWFAPDPRRILWSVLARFERRLTSSFGRDRVWMAGDAGHLTGPVGVQSMNVGLSEARDLAVCTASVLRGGEQLDRFDSYQEERSREWRRLLGLDGGLKPRAGADEWIANKRDRILPCLPGSGRELELMAEQLGLEFVQQETARTD